MYQFEVMNNIFDAMEEWIVHFGSRLSYMATSVTQMQCNQGQIRDVHPNLHFSLDLYSFYYFEGNYGAEGPTQGHGHSHDDEGILHLFFLLCT